MPELLITRLRCLRTEDFGDGDEPKLRIVADGNRVGDFSGGNIQAGDHLLINQRVSFTNRVNASLYDVDLGGFPDPDDFLGEIEIKATDDQSTGVFDRDDAHYVLEWEVIPPPPPSMPPEAGGNDDGNGNISNGVYEIGLGTHKLPNEPRLCFQHGVDTRSIRVKVWAEIKHPSLTTIQDTARGCAKTAAGASLLLVIGTEGAGAGTAIAAFKASFVACLQARLGTAVANDVKVDLKWKTEKGDWSGH